MKNLKMQMKGQWIGNFLNNMEGYIILNIDSQNRRSLSQIYTGKAYIFITSGEIHSFCGEVVNVNSSVDGPKFCSVNIAIANGYLINIEKGLPLNAAELQKQNTKKIIESFTLFGMIRKGENRFLFDYAAQISGGEATIYGQIAIERSDLYEESVFPQNPTSWVEFKSSINSNMDRDFFYRGQGRPHKLSTSFHRSGRNDIEFYFDSDISHTHRILSSQTSHYFRLNDPDERSAFLYLLQHHGYPTPLLDWTFSPYIAAFFAIRGLSKAISQSCNGHVRIFRFDYQKWLSLYQNSTHERFIPLHLSVLDPTIINNSRALPQQAVTLFTNIADIESYIASKESQHKTKFLETYDIPYSELNQIYKDLKHMGVTAGALFPGLDGTCESLRNENFEMF